jgi:hypothetical protein
MGTVVCVRWTRVFHAGVHRPRLVDQFSGSELLFEME